MALVGKPCPPISEWFCARQRSGLGLGCSAPQGLHLREACGCFRRPCHPWPCPRRNWAVGQRCRPAVDASSAPPPPPPLPTCRRCLLPATTPTCSWADLHQGRSRGHPFQDGAHGGRVLGHLVSGLLLRRCSSNAWRCRCPNHCAAAARRPQVRALPRGLPTPVPAGAQVPGQRAGGGGREHGARRAPDPRLCAAAGEAAVQLQHLHLLAGSWLAGRVPRL